MIIGDCVDQLVEEVVVKALAKDPSKRFGSVSEFAEALEWASYEASIIEFQARPRLQFMPPFPFG